MDNIEFVESLSKDERSILLYLETCLVDRGGLAEGVRMNAADHEAIKKFQAHGLIRFGRTYSKLLSEAGSNTNWVQFTPAAWDVVSLLRQRCALHKGPLARKVFAAIPEGDPAT